MQPEPTPLFRPEALQRRVFMVFSARDMAHASVCLEGLIALTVEPLDLALIVDGPGDAAVVRAFLEGVAGRERHRIRVLEAGDLDALAAERFGRRAALRGFRSGHPCWRKITDPLLLSGSQDEIIVLDPDLFFPNAFAFEPMPERGVALMFQHPNCLFPPAAVRRALVAGVPLADHVDIGVAQLRAGLLDPDWLEELLGAIGAQDFTPFMHVEALVWSALAMRVGGGHLDRARWRCWERGRALRLALAAGLPGRWALRMEPLSALKCIHVSGPSKHWVVEGLRSGALRYGSSPQLEPSPLRPYRRFTPERFARQQRLKRVVHRLTGIGAGAGPDAGGRADPGPARTPGPKPGGAA